jgi:hypothetical protein
VDAYQLEGSPPNYSIDVYDSKQPFDPTENASDGDAHRLAFRTSRIRVRGGSWTFASTSGQIADFGVDLSKLSYHDSALVVTDPASLAFQPQPITDPLELAGLAIFGTAQTASADRGAIEPSVITQLADSAGHTLLNGHGGLNSNPRTRLVGAPFVPSTAAGSGGGKPHTPVSSILPRTVSGIRATVHDTAAGPDGHTVVGGGFVSEIATKSDPGTVDHFRASATGDSFSTTAASKPLTLTMLDDPRKQAGTAARTIQLTTTTFGHGGDAIAQLPGDGGLQIRHRGPETTASLTISAPSASAGLQTFTASHVRLGANATVRVTAIRWQGLQHSTIRVTSHGHTVELRNGHRQPRLASIAAVRRRALPGGRVALTVVSHLKALPSGARREFVWVIRRGGRKVAADAAVQSAGTRRATYAFAPKQRGRYTATVAVVVTTAGATASTSTAI